MEGVRLRNSDLGDFPGGSVVKISPSNAGESGSIPDWGAKTQYAAKKPKHKTEAILQRIQ